MTFALELAKVGRIWSLNTVLSLYMNWKCHLFGKIFEP